MSATATTTTQLPAVAGRESNAVGYPEGHWIAQSVWHGDAVRQTTDALLSHFSQRDDVLVAMELVVYYERGNRQACVQPDVQVVLGVDRGGNCSSFRVWEEGKAPDFVLEVASPSTAENNARRKASEYARIGVREYWRLDPEGSLMGAPLEGYVASGGQYDPVEAVGRAGRGRHLRSQVLGLDLRAQKQDGATVLVFRDPRTGEEFDGTLEEAERRRRIAERDRRAAEKRASAAENQVQREAGLRHAAEERVRALEQCLQNLTARAPRARRDS